jgi:hypothetical protein
VCMYVCGVWSLKKICLVYNRFSLSTPNSQHVCDVPIDAQNPHTGYSITGSIPAAAVSTCIYVAGAMKHFNSSLPSRSLFVLCGFKYYFFSLFSLLSPHSSDSLDIYLSIYLSERMNA